jgi:serine/threonine protein kinase
MTPCDSIIGSYRILREIGHGGMADVYEAEHVLLPRRAAVKVMRADLVKQTDMARRMIQEASILEDVRHPGLVRVFECNVLPDGRPWIAMELVEGETLAAVLHEHGVLAPRDVARLIADVADALTAVHATGVVHRDLKPANLIMTSDPSQSVRVIDWGIARLGSERLITLDGMTPGTPMYMSPEQSAGENIAGPCDIYSLGVIAYEALSGQPPFDGRTLAEVVCKHIHTAPAMLCDRSSAPSGLCNLIHRMLDKHAAMRPSTTEVFEVAREIAHELANELAPSAVLIDPDMLEAAAAEQVPSPRRLRWTPQIQYVWSDTRLTRPIVPRALNDQVNGEILAH